MVSCTGDVALSVVLREPQDDIGIYSVLASSEPTKRPNLALRASRWWWFDLFSCLLVLGSAVFDVGWNWYVPPSGDSAA